MWESWIQSYGYFALFLGAMLEGEAVLIVAGYTLSRGYLDPIPAFLVAAAGATVGDGLYFWIGRRFGARLIRGRPKLRPLRARATLLIRRRGHSAAFLQRFAYGLRMVLLVVLGAVRMRPLTFHLFDALSALCFAALYLTLGYLFGQAIQEFLGRVGPWETALIVGVLVLGAVTWALREWWLSRAKVRP